ncbi:unnamed protein product [Protopolystoma xenopodis]|uniref:REJ domain-containing protein n=1 Tax=Protopolystoma xenopodis TaxID=117903 RepID=A0A3S4ZCN6_9PLAT|nr:unnamed protein product [Protopolystoma xenopodis]
MRNQRSTSPLSYNSLMMTSSSSHGSEVSFSTPPDASISNIHLLPASNSISSASSSASMPSLSLDSSNKTPNFGPHTKQNCHQDDTVLRSSAQQWDDETVSISGFSNSSLSELHESTSSSKQARLSKDQITYLTLVSRNKEEVSLDSLLFRIFFCLEYLILTCFTGPNPYGHC